MIEMLRPGSSIQVAYIEAHIYCVWYVSCYVGFKALVVILVKPCCINLKRTMRNLRYTDGITDWAWWIVWLCRRIL
jgi:hypothetical protein